MRWKPHVRFGGRAGETDLPKDKHRAPVRSHCPAVLGKCRCPLRPSSMALSNTRPEILAPPEHAPACGVQQSVTVPPSVNAKIAQKHDYPSAAHRRSYARRSAAERSSSRLKDPAGINIDVRGWCKLMGIVPESLFVACACVVVNFGLIDSFEAHRAEEARRAVLAGHDARSPRSALRSLGEARGAPRLGLAKCAGGLIVTW